MGGGADGDYGRSLEIHGAQALAAQYRYASRTFRLKYVTGLRICGHPRGLRVALTLIGHRTGYDIRQGQYWVPIEGEWYPVPPEAVIKTENPIGEAIVWYQGAPEGDLPRRDWYRIICFVPSSDV